MKTISVSIGNKPTEKNGMKDIETLTFSIEGKDDAQCVGKALKLVNDELNSQYDTPTVNIAGIELKDTEAKKCKGDFFAFKLNFPVLRESILAQLAFSDKETMTEYMRRTDRNGVFTATKDGTFSEVQVAAQAKENVRVVRDLSRWASQDAKDSVIPEEVATKRLQLKEIADVKRKALKASAKKVATVVTETVTA
jgi:hypothetical protein